MHVATIPPLGGGRICEIAGELAGQATTGSDVGKTALLDYAAETALLDYAAERATRTKVLRVTGVEAESDRALCVVDDAQWLDVPSADPLVLRPAGMNPNEPAVA